MSVTFQPAAPGPVVTTASPASRILTTAKRAWVSYMNWRIERAAIDQLSAMSDRQLKDIGLTRSEVVAAARGCLRPRLTARQGA